MQCNYPDPYWGDCGLCCAVTSWDWSQPELERLAEIRGHSIKQRKRFAAVFLPWPHFLLAANEVLGLYGRKDFPEFLFVRVFFKILHSRRIKKSEERRDNEGVLFDLDYFYMLHISCLWLWFDQVFTTRKHVCVWFVFTRVLLMERLGHAALLHRPLQTLTWKAYIGIHTRFKCISMLYLFTYLKCIILFIFYFCPCIFTV